MYHFRRLSRRVCVLIVTVILAVVSIGGLSAQDGGGPADPLWSIEFTPPLDPSPCGISGSGGFTSQAFSSDASTGAVDVIWSPATPAIHVVGTLSAESQFTATITCTNTDYSGISGEISATWSGATATRFTGTYSLGETAGAVVITGWSSKTPMPQALFGVGAAEADGLLYVIGGATSGIEGSGGLDGVNLNQIYNPADDSWSTDTPMLQPRKAPGVAAHDGKIYAAGGIASGILLATVEVYDPVLHTWTNAANLSQARARFALVSAGGSLYAIGGQISTDGSVANTTSSVERYNPSTDTAWVEVDPLPEPRGALAAGALNGGATIIVAGGGTNALTGSGGSTTPYLYDVATNTWSQAVNAPMLFQMGLAGGAVVGNALYVWGYNSNCVQPGQIFIPAAGGQADGWSLLAAMPTNRSSFGMAAVGDVIYAIGGQPSSQTEVATLESYSVTPASHLQIQTTPVQPCGGGGGGGGGGVPTFSGGGQSAEVNEFLAYDGISASRTTVSGGEVTFTIFYGTTIDASSFHATLDGLDVTAYLNPAPGTSETVELGDLSRGRHVMVLTVSGLTSRGRTATERDRLTFVVP